MSLLRGVKEGDSASWTDFFNTYRPLIWLIGAKYNLSADEKEILVQDVMNDFFNAQAKFTYDPARAKFRTYFSRIVHHRIYAILRERQKRRQRERHEDDDFSLDNLPDENPSGLDTRWDAEWRLHVLTQAREEVRRTMDPVVVQVFEMWQFQEADPKVIARQFGLSLATVYNYRTRMLAALKKAILEMEA